jgi:hypothetical protein
MGGLAAGLSSARQRYFFYNGVKISTAVLGVVFFLRVLREDSDNYLSLRLGWFIFEEGRIL